MLLDYLFPETTEQALSILKEKQGQARVIAGGTDLLLDMKEGKKEAAVLVDITRIPGLKEIKVDNGMVQIGAAVTHNQAAKSELVREKALALAQAARTVGSLQIRNSATVVGNVVNAQPAADTAVALTAFDAVAEVLSPGKKEYLPLEELYTDRAGKSALDSASQLVTRIQFPALLKNQGSAFERLEQRKALALPMLNAAVVVSLSGESFEWVRIAMAPVGTKPVRATEAEALLAGAKVTPEIIEEAAKTAIAQANPRNSLLRGSREYRLEVLPVLIRRALESAVREARNNF
ncbi:xanthine dehydrogenase family protein subunit M [Desulfitobacterium sp.]|uniref:FAD binding domain-containing protein n=1 Tax=Desulfitobacterium sp. TaxID=49981 RepID=UPI002B205E93|nr:xanthine dehydrogenase family protein subunit M [Desulfitobacterium sp.]MEA4900281.1 xanthine dehydrogenase family protein subunit M [Desulfitobacterium sp.]